MTTSRNGVPPVKRLLDVAVACALLPAFVVFLPVMWLRGRIRGVTGLFFRQERVGLAGRPLRVLKFRTLKNEGTLPGPGEAFSLARRLGIDELPQVLHVLCGDMSCVGPRPLVPAELTDAPAADVVLRQSVPPGLTGVAQICRTDRLRRGAPGRELMARDLWYVRNRSVKLDLSILLGTAAYVLSRGRIRPAVGPPVPAGPEGAP